MRAAVALRDVVGEAQHGLVIAVGPLEGRLDRDAVLLADDIDRLADQRGFLPVDMLHESFHAAFVFQRDLERLGAALVAEDDLHAAVEEGEFAQAVFQRLAVIVRHCEGRGRREEAHRGAGIRLAILALWRGPAPNKRRFHAPALDEAHEVLIAFAVDRQVQPVGQCVDDRHAHAVQAAGDLVGVLVEFPAGVQLGHDHFGRRDAFAGMQADRDAPAVVGHFRRAVGVQRDRHAVGMAGERFVDRVVDDFVDHVVQARAIVGIADVHAGAFAHRVEALQDLDGICAILAFAALFGGLGDRVIRHGKFFLG